MTKPPVARKLAVGHLCVRQLVFWLLVVPSFNYFKMHAWFTSMRLLLHSAFMLSVMKLLLRVEVGVCALNSHENYSVDQGQSWKNYGIVFFNFCWNPENRCFCVACTAWQTLRDHVCVILIGHGVSDVTLF